MDYIRYKGKGEHSVSELEIIIQQREAQLSYYSTGRVFKTVRVSERLPDFGLRILFLNQNYDGEFMSDYKPDELIEIKKGRFIEIKDCKIATDFIKNNFTHWLESTNK